MGEEVRDGEERNGGGGKGDRREDGWKDSLMAAG